MQRIYLQWAKRTAETLQLGTGEEGGYLLLRTPCRSMVVLEV
jgi:hypothetical protein